LGFAKHPREFTVSFALFTFLFVAVGLIAYYGVQYARDLRSRALITEELVSEMRVLTRADVMNQDGKNLELPMTQESWFGTGRFTRSSYLGLRFTGLTLPADAQILAAKIEVVSSQDQANQAELLVYAERNQNPEEFSVTNPPSRRLLTSTSQRVLDGDHWQSGATYAFDVTGVIQELYQNVQPKDKIVLILIGRGEKNKKKFIYNSLAGELTPKLAITYTLPQLTPTPTPVVDETIIDVLLAPLQRGKPTTPTPSPQPTPTVIPTATPTSYVKPSPTPCPYPPDDPRCGASDQPTPIPNPNTPIPKSPITPTPCPYPPDDPRCGS